VAFLSLVSFAIMMSNVPEGLGVPAPADRSSSSVCGTPYLDSREYLSCFLWFF
jgi:hypothetical protein